MCRANVSLPPNLNQLLFTFTPEKLRSNLIYDKIATQEHLPALLHGEGKTMPKTNKNTTSKISSLICKHTSVCRYNSTNQKGGIMRTRMKERSSTSLSKSDDTERWKIL